MINGPVLDPPTQLSVFIFHGLASYPAVVITSIIGVVSSSYHKYYWRSQFHPYVILITEITTTRADLPDGPLLKRWFNVRSAPEIAGQR